MRERGFSLIEVLVVMAVAGILLSMGTLFFHQMKEKSDIEKEATLIYTTLMQVRLEALYTKTPRTVMFSTPKQMNVYPGSDTTVAPVTTYPLSYPVVVSSNSLKVDFDASGLLLKTERCICVDPTGTLANNSATVDSVDVTMAKTYMGKRISGGACVPASIDQK